MKVAGLITEYNPFHNGHLYHIEKTRKMTGADFIVVVMSGDFVQRGAPALLDKYSRTYMALMGGADLVLELPAAYALSSAEYFAYGAVKVLEGTGVIDEISFGSEAGSVKILTEIADFLEAPSPEFANHLKSHLKAGRTFPKARELALIECASEKKSIWEEAISSPNNILGIEYIRALKKTGSSIRPVTTKRFLTGYHDLSLDSPISSATAIRKALGNKEKQDGLKAIQKSVPEYVFERLKNGIHLEANDFSSLLSYRLLTLPEEELTSFLDVSEELARRILSLRTCYSSIEDLTSRVKSKQYTHTRVSRALFHILLDIKPRDIYDYEKEAAIPYLRVLGMKKKSSLLMKEMKKRGSSPLLMKAAREQHPMLLKDLQASHIYNSIVYHKFGRYMPNEYKRGPVFLE